MKLLRNASVVVALLFSATAWAQDTTADAGKPVAAAAPAAAEAAPPDPAAEEAAAHQRAQAFFESFHRQTGLISIASGRATLNVPDSHYFIGAEDARRVIVDLWGNPPETGHVEGMIFPRDGNPAEGSWGAVVEFSAEGYVSDEDASTADYADLLRQMQQSTVQENEARRASGFPEVTLVGWAEAPHYDAATHKIYWGKDLRFSGGSLDALNYDIRVLGREGFLIISFVSVMPDLESIRASTPAVLAMADFTPGNRYADYREGVDARAAYGIGGLIAGGTLAAVAQKTGILALILAFGKKFIVLIGVAIAAIGGWVRRMFGGNNNDPPSS